MAYLSPFYAPHFSRDLSDGPPPLHNANAFIMPERLYHPHRITTSNTWSILTDSPPTVTPEQRTEQAYRSFQSDCYSAAPGTPTPNHFQAHREAEWWPPRLRRGHRDGSRVALVLGWLCLFLLAAMAFAVCWVVGHQTAQGWVFSHLASAARWALEALKRAVRKAWSAVRFGLRRLSSTFKTAMAWLQDFFRFVAPRARSLVKTLASRAYGLSGAGLGWMRSISLRVHQALPRCEPSPLWLLSACMAFMLLLTLPQKPAGDVGPVYVLVSRFQSHGSGPWPLSDRL